MSIRAWIRCAVVPLAGAAGALTLAGLALAGPALAAPGTAAAGAGGDCTVTMRAAGTAPAGGSATGSGDTAAPPGPALTPWITAASCGFLLIAVGLARPRWSRPARPAGHHGADHHGQVSSRPSGTRGRKGQDESTAAESPAGRAGHHDLR